MLIEAKDISSTCKEIMNDPLIKIATTKKKRDRAVNEAKRDGMAPQEILFNNRRTSGEIYLNMKERITIELFKSLFTLIGNPANEETMNALQQTGQLTEERDEKSKEPTYKISMNPGDINIRFDETELSKKISNEKSTKHGVLLVGNKCFIEQSISMESKPSEDPCNIIVLASQNDLQEILKHLQEIE